MERFSEPFDSVAENKNGIAGFHREIRVMSYEGGSEKRRGFPFLYCAPPAVISPFGINDGWRDDSLDISLIFKREHLFYIT